MKELGNNGRVISVVICTYNRAEKLGNALTSLAALDPRPESWELLVVDNGSSDNTEAVVRDFAAPAGCRAIYVHEPRRGLAQARNRGVQESSGDIIAFTDDDCRVDRSWLAALMREFADPTLHLLGGRVELFNPADQPVAVRMRRERLVLSGRSETIAEIPGCNFAVRRAVFARVGGFDLHFGACGIVPSGEDTDFFYRVLALGGGVVYAPDFLAFHDHGRRRKDIADALRHGYAKGRGGVYAKHIRGGDRRAAKLAWWEIRELIGELFGAVGARRRAARLQLSGVVAGALQIAWSGCRPGSEPRLQ